jgi:hypothetical protein
MNRPRLLLVAALLAASCGQPAVSPPLADAGAHVSDAALADASGTGPDASQPGGDASEPALDAALPGLDAAPAGQDAAEPGQDAAQAGQDAAQTGPDAATPVLVGFALANSHVHESAGPAQILVVLDRAGALQVSVPFVVTAFSAQPGVDYAVATASPLVFAPGVTSAAIQLTIVDDGVQEPGEILEVALGAPTDAVLGPVFVHTLTVDDNDDLSWPGSGTVVAADNVQSEAGNWSGVSFEPGATSAADRLWAVRNGPSKLYRLALNPSTHVWDIETSWSLSYPGGGGAPDSEGVTLAEWSDTAVYVAVERDNANGGTSRLGILRFDTATGAATHDWNLTHSSSNPETLDVAAGANSGLEAVTWVPDAHLVAHGFRDDARAVTYSPAGDPDHGTGLFFAGLEANGAIYVYALNHADSSFRRLATVASGLPMVMGLEFDRETGYLWAHCDNSCGNQATVRQIEENPASAALGRFVVRRPFQRPAGLPDSNFKGIALAPESECSAGLKKVIWVDDSNLGSASIREGQVRCGAFDLSP